MNTKIKICGIRSIDDLSLSLQCGANAIGLIVGAKYVTEDNLSIEKATEIWKKIPPFVSSVLVSHGLCADEILSIHNKVSTTTIQLQNNISKDNILIIRKSLPYIKLIKAIHVTGEESIKEAISYKDIVDAILLDTKTSNRIGGTGITHDWNISKKIVSILNKPVILAGGLNPTNITDAVTTVKPFAVDVNSGIEDFNGNKSPELTSVFIRKIHALT